MYAYQKASRNIVSARMYGEFKRIHCCERDCCIGKLVNKKTRKTHNILRNRDGCSTRDVFCSKLISEVYVSEARKSSILHLEFLK